MRSNINKTLIEKKLIFYFLIFSADEEQTDRQNQSINPARRRTVGIGNPGIQILKSHEDEMLLSVNNILFNVKGIKKLYY